MLLLLLTTQSYAGMDMAMTVEDPNMSVLREVFEYYSHLDLLYPSKKAVWTVRERRVIVEALYQITTPPKGITPELNEWYKKIFSKLLIPFSKALLYLHTPNLEYLAASQYEIAHENFMTLYNEYRGVGAVCYSGEYPMRRFNLK